MRFVYIGLGTLALFVVALMTGAVDIPATEVLGILMGKDTENTVWRVIVLESRLPMAMTALLSSASLSIAGLMLQTTFQNPLAGPSILGVSSGASMGVAIVMLLGGGALASAGALQYVSVIAGAIAGAATVILLLLGLSSSLRSSAMLLIAGIMLSYLASSVISLLNFFAPADGVKSFVVWGLGSFGGVTASELPLFCTVLAAALFSSALFIKPLNALLLGERYTANMGYSVKRLRSLLLCLSGILTAFVTAFCGPIGFIGIVVPHIARMIFKTSNHSILIPATMLCGAALTLACSVLTTIPGSSGVLPINAITPVIGVPVIIYILIQRRSLRYFN